MSSTIETVQKAVLGDKKEENKKPIMERFADNVKETKVTYRRLGKSGLKVSVPILGAMSFGSAEWAPWIKDEAAGLEILKAAYDRGLNTWDTANVYSNGESEKIIAKAIKTFNIPRDRVVILTKCFFAAGPEPGFSGFKAGDDLEKSSWFSNQRGLSRAAIFNQVEASLKRLETDYIDLLQIHRFDPNTPIEETMKALHDLVQSGKVHYIGASSMWAYQFAQMQFVAEKNGWTKFVSMQNHYNMLYREEEREMIPFCNETGVGLIPWAPLARGHLARPRKDFGSTERSAGEAKDTTGKAGHSDVDLEVISRVEKLAEQKGWKMTHVSLAWILKRVTSPIVGFSSVERIDEAVGVRGKELTEEEDKSLSELYKPVPISGHS